MAVNLALVQCQRGGFHKSCRFVPSWIIFSSLFICFTQIPGTESTATIFINFRTYNHLEFPTLNNSCCITELQDGVCGNVCNYIIEVCLGNSKLLPCASSSTILGDFNLQETPFVFPDVVNPVALELATWQGSVLVTIRVNATATDRSADHLQFLVNNSTPVTGQVKSTDYTELNIPGTGHTQTSQMTVSVAVSCDSNYYTDTCDVYCQDFDSCEGHYTCDLITGSRICMSGWEGPFCNISLVDGLQCSGEYPSITADTVVAFMGYVETKDLNAPLDVLGFSNSESHKWTTPETKMSSFGLEATNTLSVSNILGYAQTDISVFQRPEPLAAREIHLDAGLAEMMAAGAQNIDATVPSELVSTGPLTFTADQHIFTRDSTQSLATEIPTAMQSQFSSLTPSRVGIVNTEATIHITDTFLSFSSEDVVPTFIAKESIFKDKMSLETERQTRLPDSDDSMSSTEREYRDTMGSYSPTEILQVSEATLSTNIVSKTDIDLSFTSGSRDVNSISDIIISVGDAGVSISDSARNNAASELQELKDTVEDIATSMAINSHRSDFPTESLPKEWLSVTKALPITETWNSFSSLSVITETRSSIISPTAVIEEGFSSVLSSPTIGLALSPVILNPGKTSEDRYSVSSLTALTNRQLLISSQPFENDVLFSSHSPSVTGEDWSPTTSTSDVTQIWPSGTHVTNLSEIWPSGTHVNNLSEIWPSGTHVTNLSEIWPSGTHVNNLSEIWPSGTHVNNLPEIWPSGTHVNNLPEIWPSGTHVNNLSEIWPSGTHVTNLSEIWPSGTHVTNLPEKSSLLTPVAQLVSPLSPISNMADVWPTIASVQPEATLTPVPPVVDRQPIMPSVSTLPAASTPGTPAAGITEILASSTLESSITEQASLPTAAPPATEIEVLVSATKTSLPELQPPITSDIPSLTELVDSSTQLSAVTPELLTSSISLTEPAFPITAMSAGTELWSLDTSTLHLTETLYSVSSTRTMNETVTNVTPVPGTDISVTNVRTTPTITPSSDVTEALTTSSLDVTETRSSLSPLSAPYETSSLPTSSVVDTEISSSFSSLPAIIGGPSSVTPTPDITGDPSSVIPTPDITGDPSSVTPTPDITGDPSSVTPTPDITGDPSSVTSTPDITGDPSSVTSTPDITGDPSSVTSTPDITGDPSSVTPTPDITGDPSSVTPTPDIIGGPSSVTLTPDIIGDPSLVTPSFSDTGLFLTSTPDLTDAVSFVTSTPDLTDAVSFVPSSDLTGTVSFVTSTSDLTDAVSFVTSTPVENGAQLSPTSVPATTAIWLFPSPTVGTTVSPSLVSSSEIWSPQTPAVSEALTLGSSTVSVTGKWASLPSVSGSIKPDTPVPATEYSLSSTPFTASTDMWSPVTALHNSVPAVAEWSSVTPVLDVTAQSSFTPISNERTLPSITSALDETTQSSLTPVPTAATWSPLTQMLVVSAWSSLTPVPTETVWSPLTQAPSVTVFSSLTPVPELTTWISPPSAPDVTTWISATTGPNVTTWISLTSAPAVTAAWSSSTSLTLSASFSSELSTQLSSLSSTGLPVTFTSLESPQVTRSLYMSDTATPTAVYPTLTTEIPFATITTTTADTTTTTTSRPTQITGELFIAGPVSPNDYTDLLQIVRESLMTASRPASACCCSVATDDSNLYFDDRGSPLLRLEFTFNPPAGSDLPNVDRSAMIVQTDIRLTMTEAFRVNGNHVYQSIIFGPDVVFNLDIVGEILTEDYKLIEEAVTAAWLQKNPAVPGFEVRAGVGVQNGAKQEQLGTWNEDIKYDPIYDRGAFFYHPPRLRACECQYHISILHGRNCTGKYGIPLTRLYNTVSRNGILQSTKAPEKPGLEDFVVSFKTSPGFFQLYPESDVISDDLQYEVTLAEVASLTSPAGVARNQALTAEWTNYLQETGQCLVENCRVTINYGKPKEHYTDNSNEISSLIYYVALNDNFINPTTVRGPSLEAAGPSFASCFCQHLPVLSVDLYGYVSYFKVMTVLTDILGNDSIVIRREHGYDISGNLVTHVIFKPAYFDTPISMGSQDDIQAVSLKHNVMILNRSMSVRRRYQLVLEGATESCTVSEMANLLKQAWANNNKELVPDDLRLSVVSVDSESLVKTDESPVTVVDYIVTLGTIDASLTIVEEPPFSIFQVSLTSRQNLTLCGCAIRIILNITARGLFVETNSSLESFKVAMEGAWDEANEEYIGNITVVVLSVESKEIRATGENQEETEENERKQEITFKFIINPTEGQHGVTDRDMDFPEADVTNKYFQLHNLDLVVGSESQSSEEYLFPWYIPVGAVLAVVISVLLVYMFYRILQEQKKVEKQEEGEDPKDFLNDSENGHLGVQPLAFENDAIKNRESRMSFSARYVSNTDPEGQTEL